MKRKKLCKIPKVYDIVFLKMKKLKEAQIGNIKNLSTNY
jgi:hypothetical protein